MAVNTLSASHSLDSNKSVWGSNSMQVVISLVS